jgi:tetratricopeptide (TPR) repeat protein
MQNNLEYIDEYFQGIPDPDATRDFEKRVSEDPEFANDVAFYLASKQAIKQQLDDQKKTRFKEIYALNTPGATRPKAKLIRILWPYIAVAAVVTGIIICWYLFIRPPSTQQLAQNYITEHLGKLGVSMSSSKDELQRGLSFYNEGKLKQALQIFEKMIILDSHNFTAEKYAGITSLRLQQYDKAIHYFKLLEDQPNLYANPGAFFQATTLLKRNLPGDKQKAIELLNHVVHNDLEGKETAELWLKKM